MDYIIRKTKIEEMVSVMDAHSRSIRQLCSKDYNQDQVSKWSSVNYTESIWHNTINNEFHICVEVNGRIEGLCHAKVDEDGDGHIVGLYFTDVIAGKGIGREVFEQAIAYIRKAGSTKVFITGTITAKGFYERMGFKAVEKKQVSTRGATLDCYKMEMDLRAKTA